MGASDSGKKTATRKKTTTRKKTPARKKVASKAKPKAAANSAKPKASPKPKAKAARRPSGRPAWAPDERTRQLVRNMSSQGLPHVSIAANVGTTDKTLRKHCPDELGAARSELAKLTFSNLATYVRGQRAVQRRDPSHPGRLITKYVQCTGKEQLAAIRLMLNTVLRREVNALLTEGEPDTYADSGINITVLPNRHATGEEDDDDDAALDAEQARYDAVPDDDDGGDDET